MDPEDRAVIRRLRRLGGYVGPTSDIDCDDGGYPICPRRLHRRMSARLVATGKARVVPF